MLVSKGELLERVTAMEELEQKVKEQAMQSEYQSHLREQYFQDALTKQKAEAHAKLVEASEHYDEPASRRRRWRARCRSRCWRRTRRT